MKNPVVYGYSGLWIFTYLIKYRNCVTWEHPMKKVDPFKSLFYQSCLRKRCVIFCVLLTLTSTIFTQTTNISGIINTYHRVIEIIPAKACLRVADPTGININSRIMVVQMKGASVSTANNSSFGDTTSLNNAGNYEIGTICYIIGDSIFLFHTLLNNYDITNQVQIVQFAEYYSANVIDTVKALSWSNTNAVGGVIAIFADQDLTLNAPIYADSAGYRGGAYVLSNGSCSNASPASGYYYNGASTSPQNGAYKGEGIANIIASQSGGRGAPANGGGGGNNHNNSGGGGANLSAGGTGGGNSSTSGCRITLRGLGGKALSSWNGSKIFMGGGGGAGHAKYRGLYQQYGGNGGGIIFILAQNIIGNSFSISANGGMGGHSQSDGAGAGGAGGTIIMNVTNYSGSLLIHTKGGAGGNSEDGGNIGRCYGGGGGGSGGVIYFNNTVPAVSTDITGGSAGLEISPDPACSLVPAVAGNNGIIAPGYSYRTSTNPAGYCLLLLPSKLVFFNAGLNDNLVTLSWKILHPESVKYFIIEKMIVGQGWSVIGTIPGNDTTSIFHSEDKHPVSGANFYRLKVIEKSNQFYYSKISKIDYKNFQPGFTFYPNPASRIITIIRDHDKKDIVLVTDLSGKFVFKKEITGRVASMELPILPKGLFLIQLENAVKKLVIY